MDLFEPDGGKYGGVRVMGRDGLLENVVDFRGKALLRDLNTVAMRQEEV